MSLADGLVDLTIAGLGHARPVAWRCEHCRRWQPAAYPSVVILVDEIGDRWVTYGAVKKKVRFARRMVVCDPCRRSIADVPGEPGKSSTEGE